MQKNRFISITIFTNTHLINCPVLLGWLHRVFHLHYKLIGLQLYMHLLLMEMMSTVVRLCHILITKVPHWNFNNTSTSIALTTSEACYQLCLPCFPSHTLQAYTYHTTACNGGTTGPTSQRMKLKFRTDKNIPQDSYHA